MAKPGKQKKSKDEAGGKIRVDFSGTDAEIRKHSQRAGLLPEGDYLFKILKGELKTSESSGNRYINWRAQVLKPTKYKGKTQFGMTSLSGKSLWNLRNLIHAATGKNVAGKRAVDINFSSIEGQVVGGTVEQEEYDGKMRSRINTWWPKEEYEEAEGDDDDEDDEDEEDLDEVDIDDI